jgi:RNA polymerase sigma factor (sigma-70 family)
MLAKETLMEPVEEVLLRHRNKLLGFIQSKVSDPDLAEDVFQDSLLHAIHAAGDLREEDKLLPWSYRILNNAIIDTYRRKSTESQYLTAYGQNEVLAETPENDAVICECFRVILPSLKPEYTEVIETLDLSNGEPEDLALRLKITPNNLKVRRHRARQALRLLLEQTCQICAVHGCLNCTCGSN